MKVLGIDPGLDKTGYGLIENNNGNISVIEAGIIRTLYKDGLPARLEAIYLQIQDIARNYHPDICVVEQLYSHYKHRMTAVLMGHARGIILCCCRQNGIAIKEYPAKTPKRVITGNGNASKLQVQRVVNKLLNIKDAARPFDVSDALALCLTYVHHLQACNPVSMPFLRAESRGNPNRMPDLAIPAEACLLKQTGRSFIRT
ncbi:MAG: crossover junction endodeoxyribonuclease RuvC [Candidatus Omnitrophica bacterium]|nr:crossover junction endodeoxyribonuclease RuvC [Candidatus Omnitrophota bacterium]